MRWPFGHAKLFLTILSNRGILFKFAERSKQKNQHKAGLFVWRARRDYFARRVLRLDAVAYRPCKIVPDNFVEPRGSLQVRRTSQTKKPAQGWSLYLARPEGFEPPTTWFEAKYSIQLSYRRVTLSNCLSTASG